MSQQCKHWLGPADLVIGTRGFNVAAAALVWLSRSKQVVIYEVT